MYRTATFASVFGLVALILTLSVNIQAQIEPPVFRSPADAGRTNRYRPNLIRYNEALAIRTMRTFAGAQAVYAATVGNGTYGTLAELTQEHLIGSGLADGRQAGYLFRVRVKNLPPGSPSSFEILAVPRKYGTTGRRSFYSNAIVGVLAADRKGAEAHAEDDPLDP